MARLFGTDGVRGLANGAVLTPELALAVARSAAHELLALRTGTGRPLLRMTELSLVFMALTFGVFVVYGVFAAWMREHVVSSPVILMEMRRVFALAFVALAARLALGLVVGEELAP